MLLPSFTKCFHIMPMLFIRIFNPVFQCFTTFVHNDLVYVTFKYYDKFCTLLMLTDNALHIFLSF